MSVPPNGISIDSAIFAGLILVTNTQTERHRPHNIKTCIHTYTHTYMQTYIQTFITCTVVKQKGLNLPHTWH